MKRAEFSQQKVKIIDLFLNNMELKVWVEGIQRIVCGVTETTTCQVNISST